MSNYFDGEVVLRPWEIREILADNGFEGDPYDELHELTPEAIDALRELNLTKL